jgi:hypothetical protein
LLQQNLHATYTGLGENRSFFPRTNCWTSWTRYRPENPAQQIVLEQGNQKLEGNNIGLFYTAMLCATTTGNQANRMSSAIFSIFQKRDSATHLTRQQNGQLHHKALLRQNWVRFTKEKNETGRSTTQKKK